MKELLTYFALILALLSLALNAWVCLMRRKRLERTRNEQVVHDWDERRDLNPFREWLRAQLLAGGKHKHHAFHVAQDGRVLAVNAEAFYFALFARVHDFWKMVAAAHVGCPDAFPLAVQHLERADREGRLTRVNSRCGETYVDAVFPRDLPYVYFAARVTTKEFKRAVVERKAEAANRGKRHNDIKHRI